MGSSLLTAACNCRDLGGHAAMDGRVTAFGKFWRSDAPRGGAARDADILRACGITTVLDLRTEEEASARPSAFAALIGIAYAHFPIAEGSDAPASLEAVPASYLRIALSPNMPRVFRCLADAPGGALFHCTAGKDRTGVVSAVLLSLCGVPDAEIIADYVLSRENNRERLEAFLAAHPQVDRQAVLANEKSMEGFLRLFRERFGGAEGYFADIGVPPAQVRLLREKLLGE